MPTDDQSKTLFSAKYNQHYHSIKGAMTESKYVFIESGLHWVRQILMDHKKDGTVIEQINCLEVGFGTGLNALLSMLDQGITNTLSIHYTAIEPSPVSQSIWEQLNYPNLELFSRLHQSPWGQSVSILPTFTLYKVERVLSDFLERESATTDPIHLIYFDAFSPEALPELWSESIFAQLYSLMAPGGILVTYCAKGVVKTALRSAGFQVQRLPGPPGKHHMLRAVKAS